MASITCSSAALCRAGIQVQRATSVRSNFVGTQIAQRQLVAKANKQFVVRAETTEGVDADALVKDLTEKWDKVENKTSVVIYSVGALFAVWLASTVVGALNNVPLFPKLFELVGLGYSGWFTYRYLLFKSSREELVADIEQLKKKISGEL